MKEMKRYTSQRIYLCLEIQVASEKEMGGDSYKPKICRTDPVWNETGKKIIQL